MTARRFSQGATVAVVEIPKSAFEQLSHVAECRVLWLKEHERAWFADTMGRVIGVLLEAPRSGCWSYSVCLRGEDGQYVRVAFAADIPSADLARLDLIATMRKL
jgi:hypothetical protein